MNEHERQIKFLCAFEFEHVGAAAASTARINGTSFSDNFSALSKSLALSLLRSGERKRRRGKGRGKAVFSRPNVLTSDGENWEWETHFSNLGIACRVRNMLAL